MHTITIEPAAPTSHMYRWKFWNHPMFRSRKFWVPIVVVVLLFTTVGGVTFVHVKAILAAAKPVQVEASVLKQAAKDQDLAALKQGIPEMQTKLDALQTQVNFFAFTRHWPIVGAYFQDADHAFAGAKAGLDGGKILVDATLPYADVLGFKGEQTTAVQQSSQDKISQLVLLMPSLLPAMDESSSHFATLKQQIDAIDPHRYPKDFRGIELQSLLSSVKSQIDGLENGMNQARPILQVLPSVAGAQSDKRYLLLFQNDKELRPSGGFITSAAYITFSKGKFTVSQNTDIYSMDNNKSYLPLPKPMAVYLNVPALHLRDTNFSPDFATSMRDFELYYNKAKNPPIDGIIALDTQFVEGLMRVTGPLSVPGYGQPFSAEPITVNGTKVPQVVYQLELFSEKTGGGSDRKGILGDLMQVMIKKVMADPPSSWPNYLKMIMTEGQQKHVLMYFHDADAQDQAVKQNFAGTITSPADGQDYLHINDANLAGLKSNFYLTQQTQQQVSIDADGTVHKKLTITYTNTGRFDGWLNANAHNYLRVYVPLGSKLVKTSGGDQKVTTSTDLGKTVFDNFVLVHPLEKRTVTFEYVLPFKITNGHYSEIVQKQPGAQNWSYTTMLGSNKRTDLIDGDKTISL